MKTRQEKIEEFLKGLNTEIDLLYHVDVESVESYDDICDSIENDGGFDVEIIYYYNAIKYLKENDPSLNESLSIAAEYGYEVENLNSETLASLLASQNVRQEFYELEDEINNFFEELEEEEEEEE